MKGKSPFCMTVVVALAIAMISCGGSQESSGAPEAGTPTGGLTVDMATAGSVKGTIKLDGTPPRMRPISMAAEPACARLSSEPVLTQTVVTGDDGALVNVVVYLKGDFAMYSFPTPQSPVVIDQKGCLYVPHVVGMMTGQPLNVTNSDATTHNIHPIPMNNREWNDSQPPGAGPLNRSFAREEVAIPVKCNVHPWMQTYVAVLSHPYFQVTGSDGSFELKNVPPGTYTLAAWHELYGTMEQMVTVTSQVEEPVDLMFKAAAGGD